MLGKHVRGDKDAVAAQFSFGDDPLPLAEQIRQDAVIDDPQLGLTVAEEPISLARLRDADAIFLTSSLRHAVPAVLGEERPRPDTTDRIKTIREALAKA